MTTAKDVFGLQVLSAVINVNAIADNLIVAAPVGTGRIVIIGYALVSTAANTITWKSATTALSGPMDMGVLGTLFATKGSPMLTCAPAQALNLALTAATKVAGHVSYVIDQTT